MVFFQAAHGPSASELPGILVKSANFMGHPTIHQNICGGDVDLDFNIPQLIFMCLVIKEPRSLEDQQRSLGENPRAHLSMIFLLSPELW